MDTELKKAFSATVRLPAISCIARRGDERNCVKYSVVLGT